MAPSNQQEPTSVPPHGACSSTTPPTTIITPERRRAPLSFPFLLVVSLALLLPGPLHAIQLDVEPYSTRCISDDYAPDEDSTIKLRAVGRVQENVRATVSNPDGQSVWDSYITAQTQNVPVSADNFGLYRICFSNGGSAVQRVEVGLLDRAVTLGQKFDSAKTKEHLRPLQLLFRRAELTVAGVSKELDSVRQREAVLRETSDSTNTRIQWFSIFSIVILLAVSLWQVTFLKSFFRSKKLL
ncbi:hypothetical protein VYU27_004541 [Nannochloropsis oceanica]